MIRVFADCTQDRIEVTTEGLEWEDARDFCKSIPGGKWTKMDQCWIFPLEWDTCLAIRHAVREYGYKLTICNRLWQWAEHEKARREALPDAESNQLVDLELIRDCHPFMWDKVSARPFQTVAIKWLASQGRGLVAHHPGLGKTVIVIGAVLESGIDGPILVVAPKSAAGVTWPAQIKMWCGDKVTFISSSLPKDRRGPAVKEAFDVPKGERHWIVVGPDYLRIRAKLDKKGKYVRDEEGEKIIYAIQHTIPELFTEGPWSAVIVDESHETLAGATGNKKKQSAQRLGLGALEVFEGGLRVSMTGTPTRGKDSHLWGHLNWLDPKKYSSYWNWVKQWFDVEEEGYGMIVSDKIKNKKLFYEAHKDIILRKTKAEVAPDMPPKFYAGEPLDGTGPVAVWLEMAPKQKKNYNDMVELGEVDGITTLGVLSEITRRKQFASSTYMRGEGGIVPCFPSNKFDWILEFLQERAILGTGREAEGKVIIASRFTKLLNHFHWSLTGEYSTPAFLLTGATTDAKRLAMQERFQTKGGPNVILLNKIAGGKSITLDRADDVIMIEQDNDPSIDEQVEDRAHRISRPDHKVTIWNLASLGTIEEQIARTAMERETQIKEVLDGTRGIEYVRQVLG